MPALTDSSPPLPPNDFGFSDVWFTAVKTFGMLFLVLAILIILLYFLKKVMDRKGAVRGQSAIKTLSTYYLSPKEKLLLIDVLGEKMLIGVTAQTITFLAKIEGETEVMEKIELDNMTADPFENILKKVFSKSRIEKKI